jgi:uncharacterized damage-inducible protein DinB
MNRASFAIALCFLLVSAATSGRAQEVTGFRADLMGQIEQVQHQILDLEGSIPDAKQTWRPGEGVRSISEVYSHIAFANYLIAKFAGATLPQGVSASTPEEATKWEKASTDKKVIAEQLVKSFDFVKNTIKKMPDASLETKVDFFGSKVTTRYVFLVLLSHMHEHLGQSIAYARVVGVVPPWTAAQTAAEKTKK